MGPVSVNIHQIHGGEKRDIKWSHWDTNSYKELHKTQWLCCALTTTFFFWFLLLEMDNCPTIHHNNLSLPLCQDVDIETELQTHKPINHQKHRQRYRSKAPTFLLSMMLCVLHGCANYHHLPLSSFTNIKGWQSLKLCKENWKEEEQNVSDLSWSEQTA